MSKTSVKRIVVEVPESLKIPPGEREKRLRIELALRSYEEDLVSLDQAHRIACLSKWNFLELLTREGILIHYGEKNFEENSEISKRLKVKRANKLTRSSIMVIEALSLNS